MRNKRRYLKRKHRLPLKKKKMVRAKLIGSQSICRTSSLKMLKISLTLISIR